MWGIGEVVMSTKTAGGFRFSQRSKDRMAGVDPRLIGILNRAIEITKVDFGIPHLGGYRTAEQQKELFEQGVTKADGYKNKSKHQSRLAIDVYAYIDGKASWEKEDLAMVACAILQSASQLGYTLQWGGLWKNFMDMPHFELV